MFAFADKLSKLLENIDQRKIEAKTIIPKIEKLIDVYFSLPDATTKNKMLKEVIERVEYTREKGGRWVENKDNFDELMQRSTGNRLQQSDIHLLYDQQSTERIHFPQSVFQ